MATLKKYGSLLLLLIPFLLHLFDDQIERFFQLMAWLPLLCIPGLVLSYFGFSWSSAKILGFFLFTLPFYFLLQIYYLPYTDLIFWLLSIAAIVFSYVHRKRFNWHDILAGERFFLIIFVAFLTINSFHPVLYWGEKPMDLSFLGSLLRMNEGILDDPWAAGTRIKYYMLGYISWSLPARAVGMSLEQAYMVTMAGVAAMTALASVEVYRALKVKYIYLCAGLFPFLSTASALISYFNHHSLDMTYFWSTTRVFENNNFAEFPLWSFLFADLHPHVMAYPLVLIVFAGIVHCLMNSLTKYHLWGSTIALSLIPFTNAWDFVLFSPCAFVALLLYFGKKINRELIICFLIVILSSLIAFFMTKTNSRHITFGLAEGAGFIGILSHFIFSFIPFWLFVWQQKNKRWTLFATFISIVLVCINYVVFLDRINTIFKFYTSLGLVLILFTPALVFGANARWLRVSGTIFLALSFSGSIFLVMSILKPGPYPVRTPSLNGLSFLQYALPSDAGIINYLNEQVGRPRILEAPGESFNYQRSRISAYTGLPTWIGWEHHVVLRGKTWLEIRQRKNWVNAMYESADALNAYGQLKDKRIEFIVVGPSEKSIYQSPGLAKFDQYPELFELVYEHFQAKLYRLK